MLKKIRLRVESTSTECDEQLFPASPNAPAPAAGESETERFFYDAAWHDDGKRVTISYREPKESEMGKSTTTLSFTKDEPQYLTMARSGDVKTLLLFRENECHTTLYQTPYLSFDLCVKTEKVDNDLLFGNTLTLLYVAEPRGGTAARHRFCLTVL